MVRNIYKSTVIPLQNKKECFAMLAKLDTSDMLGRTQKYCEAVVPKASSKQEAFNTIFDGSDDMSMLHLEELCRGFAPFT